ncbi:MAG: hypothetical protein BRD52_03990 [Bacteroidetes bacterium SW_4_67_19]|nr:MAG: hypothetical protein BRD52_03990 [Bacteroidetes bacterium SW_4_67_19]
MVLLQRRACRTKALYHPASTPGARPPRERFRPRSTSPIGTSGFVGDSTRCGRATYDADAGTSSKAAAMASGRASSATSAAAKIMQRNDLAPEDVRYLVPHQANRRIIEATAQQTVVAMLSPNLRVMLPMKPSQTTTSAAWASMSRPSTLPAKRRSGCSRRSS